MRYHRAIQLRGAVDVLSKENLAFGLYPVVSDQAILDLSRLIVTLK